jgi:hypothetical protein
MNLKILFVTALLGAAASDMAAGQVVRQAYEVALTNLRLPQVQAGTIAFRECENCEFIRVRVGSATTYTLNGRSLLLADFRTALANVVEAETPTVTVLHHLERDVVTNVSINL